ncbi:MAG: xanthine dehydrogenase family protein molybdopterin-binding subunit [Bacteroidota bacterium]
MNAKVTRRDFLRVSSVAGAGLVLGVSIPTIADSAEGPGDKEHQFIPNAWLRINKDGVVTIIVAKSEMGQGVRTALPMIVADELDADWSKVRVEQAIADDKHGSMGTGGSASVRTSWDMLRKAGAAARLMLVTAAARKWNVPVSECRTENGLVIDDITHKSLGYGMLVDDAAKVPVPDNPPLKKPGDFRIIGKRIPRTDAPDKVDGKAEFGIDVRVPGMLHAAVARCPVFGGSLDSYDDSKAKGMPGVKHILAIKSGVAVVAQSTWQAFSARDALVVKWKEGAGANVSSESIRAELEELSTHEGAVAEHSGDPVRVDSVAGKKLEAKFYAPFLAHATMEPMNCTAFVEKKRCTVWAPTQSPQSVLHEAAKITGMAEKDIAVHTTFLGGGFGRRLESDFAIEALEISNQLNVPVQVTWTREDDMRHDFYRPVSLHHLTGALNDEKRLVALTHRVVAPSITGQRSPDRIKNGLDRGAVEGADRMPYDIPNILVDYVMASTPVPLGPWRSVFPSQTVFALESFIDEMALAAGADPFEFRRAMMVNVPKMQRVLELAAEKAGWGKPLPTGHFHGIAFSPPAFYLTPVAEVAEVSVKEGTIKVHRVVAAIDCGIAVNPSGVEAQMEGGIVYGLSAALKGRITIEKGRVVEGNFDDYPLLTMDEMPKIDVVIVPSTDPPTGTGEPGLPAIAPAVANAVFAATGKRLREMPFKL